VNHYFIETEKRSTFIARFDGTLEHEVARNSKLASGYARETLPKIFGRQVSKESQFPQIDAEDRELPIAHLPGRAKNGSVAAQYERQVGRDGIEVLFLAEIECSNFRVLAQEWAQALRLFLYASPIGISENENSHKRPAPTPHAEAQSVDPPSLCDFCASA
jgi:hypothetical protein